MVWIGSLSHALADFSNFSRYCVLILGKYFLLLLHALLMLLCLLLPDTSLCECLVIINYA